MSIDGMKEYTIIIGEGCAGMGKYNATLSYEGGGKERMTVHHRSEAGARSCIRKERGSVPDFTTGLKRVGPVNPGEYIQDGMDERDAVKMLVDVHYNALDERDIELGIKGMNPDQITKEIYQKWKKGKGVQIIPPAQMELDLFETDA